MLEQETATGMSSAGTQSRGLGSGGRPQSLFYRDLSASPATRSASSRREVGTPGQAAAAAALWRESLGGDPPPPPFFTLEDRIERSLDTASVADPSFRSPESFKYTDGRSPLRTPLSSSMGGYSFNYGDSTQNQYLPSAPSPSPQQNQSSGSPIWWSLSKDRSLQESMSGRGGDREGGSPVPGMVQSQQRQSGGLLALEPPRDIVRPEMQRSGGTADTTEGDEWVTVFGYVLGPCSRFPGLY